MKIQYDDRCPTFCHTLKATYTLRNEHALLAGRGWRQISGRNPTYVKIVVHPSVMYSWRPGHQKWILAISSDRRSLSLIFREINVEQNVRMYLTRYFTTYTLF